MTEEKFSTPFKGRSLLTWLDWEPEEILKILSIAEQVKKEAHNNEIHQRFLGKTIALIFEKRSTRTRSSFETAFGEEGGYPVFLSTQDIQLGGKESVEDTAKVLGRMYNAIEFRGYKQEHVEKLAKFSGIPVINGLTDDFHPTQVLADVLTLKETFGNLKGLTLSYSGDGRNNMAVSLMIICAKLGINFTVLSPKELFPSKSIVERCTPFAKASGAKIIISDDLSLVKGSDCIYTDFLHCLPAIKEEEVTNDVFESDYSKVWDQAENRKHTIKAIMLALI